MKKKKTVDWKSKFIDLLIVIIGITIAFQLNNFNETSKSKHKERDYLKSFFEESNVNKSDLSLALNYSIENQYALDSLVNMLLSKEFDKQKIKMLSAKMMAIADFHPSLTTMENIKSSGEFELIRNVDLRKKLIETYDSYETTGQFEKLLFDYVNLYITPFFFKNIRFSDFSSIEEDFIKDVEFENIVLGYQALLNQKIAGYERTIEKLEELNHLLVEYQ